MLASSPPWLAVVAVLLLGAAAALAERWRLRRATARVAELEAAVDRALRKLEEANAELAARNAELERLSELKSEFLGIAAHDLKNPLGVVLGLSEILVEQCDAMRKLAPELAGSMVERGTLIRTCAQQMATLVGQLLDSVAIESGNLQLSVQPFDVAELSAGVVESNRLAALGKDITLHHAVAGSARAMVDPDRTWEILENLVSNAVKFSPPGKRVWVHVAPASEDGQSFVRVTVRDEGPGLSAEDLQNVFGRFQRLSARPTAGEHSTGLGLSIVKRLVELHGGRVWVESEPGRGAAFHVQFRAAAARAAA